MLGTCMYDYYEIQIILELVFSFVRIFIVIFGIWLIMTGFSQLSKDIDSENLIQQIYKTFFGISTGLVRVLIGLVLVLTVLEPSVLKFSIIGNF